MSRPAGITDRHLAEAEGDQLIDELRKAQDQLRADLEAMTRLHELGSLFVREGNLEPVLVEIVDAAIAISGADFGNIQLLDAESTDLMIVAHRGFPDWWLEFWNSVSKGHGVCGTALERGERVIVEDVEGSPIFAGTPALEIQRRAGVRAVQSTPLLSRSSKPLGMFSTHWRKPGRPDERSLRLLDLLARHAADIIERAQNEEALKRADEAERRRSAMLRMLADSIPDPVFVKDEQSRMVFANPATLEAIGKPAEEVLGRSDREFFDDAETGAKIVENDLRIMAAGEAMTVEERIEAPTGPRWFLSTKAPVRDAAGKITGLIGVTRDITERKRMEEELRESEEHFRAFVTASSDVVYRVSADWLEMREVHGREFVADMNAPSSGWMEKYIHPDDQPRVRAEIDEALRTKSAFHSEHRVLRVDGSTGWTFSRAVPLFDENGTIVEWFGAASDITERKRAEEELRESERKLRLAKDAANMGAWNWDLLSGELTWSDRCKPLLGLGPDTVMSYEAFKAAIHPGDRDRIDRAVKDALTKKEPYDVEMRVPSPDGTVRWLASKGEVAYAADGQAVRMDGMVMDITERKHAEALARDANEKLREADRQKNQFLAMLSHELRNPLAPIRNSLYILDRAAPGSEQARKAQAVIARSGR
jgi:PAS domain S-box-containing protein